MGTNTMDDGRSTLLRLYLVRGVLAIVWALVFARAHATLDAGAVALLVVYPLIDAVSSLVDYRAVTTGPERRVTAFNGVLSTLAAVGLGVAGSVGGSGGGSAGGSASGSAGTSTDGAAAVLATFGAWAVVSGAAQLVVGLRRRGPELGKQWPMLVSGGLSLLVGAFYVAQAAGSRPTLDVLSVYATGGGVFFVAEAALLAWAARRTAARAV